MSILQIYSFVVQYHFKRILEGVFQNFSWHFVPYVDDNLNAVVYTSPVTAL